MVAKKIPFPHTNKVINLSKLLQISVTFKKMLGFRNIT